jgi:hypothetical protein
LRRLNLNLLIQIGRDPTAERMTLRSVSGK